MILLAVFAALIAGAGILQGLFGLSMVWHFRRRRRPSSSPWRPAISVLKPLHGAEPMLEQALETLCLQEYGPFQIVFGVQDKRDPAIAVVRRLEARFPHVDIVLVVNKTLHGRNRKVGNLINMLPAARYDVLVIADSDVHAAPDYLARLADALAVPGVGLVTTLYAGLPASGTLAGALGATAITHGFLPGALMARALGRQDCLGATMALRRGTLEAVGGLGALVHHLADDHVLGELVAADGWRIELAKTVPATTVPEVRMGTLYRHELRWSRTILALAPIGFALSTVQYPLAWAMLAVALSGVAKWSLALLLAVWLGRAVVGRLIDYLLDLTRHGLASSVPIWLLPLRDLMSIAVMLASYISDEVEWRGEVLRASFIKPQIDHLDTLPLGTERS